MRSCNNGLFDLHDANPRHHYSSDMGVFMTIYPPPGQSEAWYRGWKWAWDWDDDRCCDYAAVVDYGYEVDGPEFEEYEKGIDFAQLHSEYDHRNKAAERPNDPSL